MAGPLPPSSYTILCESLGILIKIRLLQFEEESNLVRTAIKSLGSSFEKHNYISYSSYMEWLIGQVVEDPSILLEQLNLENIDVTKISNPNQLRYQILKEIYEHITGIYGTLALPNILRQLNRSAEDIHLDEDDSSNFEKEFKDILDEINDIMLKDNTDPKIPTKKISLSTPVRRRKEREKKNAPMSNKLSTLEDVKKFENVLLRNVIGQEEAIRKVIATVKLITSGLDTKATMLFIGPTGVGKTYLAKLISDGFAGMIKINCGEYSNSHEYAKLIGSPPGYIGYTETSFLAQKAEQSNSWVFVFDEIEKAHDKFFDFLLNLLEEGSVNDNSGKTLDFSKSIFILTSNNQIKELGIGKNLLGYGKSTVKYEDVVSVLKDKLKDTFSPEFLNRVDTVCFFNALKPEDVEKIIKLELKKYPVKPTEEIIKFILKNVNIEEYGAREVIRSIRTIVALPVAEAILDGKVPSSGSLFTLELDESGKVVITDTVDKAEKVKSKRQSTVDASS